MQVGNDNTYPPSYQPDQIKAGDQVFVATPAPYGGEIPMQPMNTSNQPLVVNASPTVAPGFFILNGTLVFRLGIVSLVIGLAIFVCGICCVAVFGSLNYNEASSGIWGGVFIIVAGSLSIPSGRRPNSRVLNAVNLGFHCFALACCIACLALFGMNIDYYDQCLRRIYYGRYYQYYFSNRNCPAEKDEAVVVYSIMVVLACVQFGISIAVIVFCCRAYPSCRSGDCCKNGCCTSQQTTANTPSIHQQTHLLTGHATVSQNVQSIPPGQILYMLTPVAVTTQRPQSTQANQFPQATLVMH